MDEVAVVTQATLDGDPLDRRLTLETLAHENGGVHCGGLLELEEKRANDKAKAEESHLHHQQHGESEETRGEPNDVKRAHSVEEEQRAQHEQAVAKQLSEDEDEDEEQKRDDEERKRAEEEAERKREHEEEETRRRETAALLILRVWRGRRVRKEHLKRRAAAVLIQARWRGRKARKAFKPLWNKRHLIKLKPIETPPLSHLQMGRPMSPTARRASRGHHRTLRTMLKDAYTIDGEEQAAHKGAEEDDTDRIAAVRAVTVDPPVELTPSNEEISEPKASQFKQPRGGIAAPGFSFDPTQVTLRKAAPAATGESEGVPAPPAADGSVAPVRARAPGAVAMANLRASLNKAPGQTTPVQTGMIEDTNPGLKAVRRHSAQDMKTLLLPKQDTGTVLRRKASREAPASLGHSASLMPSPMMSVVVSNDLFSSSNNLGPKKVTFSGLPVSGGVTEEDEEEDDDRAQHTTAHQAPVKSLPTKPRPTPPPKPHYDSGTPAPVSLSTTPNEEPKSVQDAESGPAAADEANASDGAVRGGHKTGAQVRRSYNKDLPSTPAAEPALAAGGSVGKSPRSTAHTADKSSPAASNGLPAYPPARARPPGNAPRPTGALPPAPHLTPTDATNTATSSSPPPSRSPLKRVTSGSFLPLLGRRGAGTGSATVISSAQSQDWPQRRSTVSELLVVFLKKRKTKEELIQEGILVDLEGEHVSTSGAAVHAWPPAEADAEAVGTGSPAPGRQQGPRECYVCRDNFRASIFKSVVPKVCLRCQASVCKKCMSKRKYPLGGHKDKQPVCLLCLQEVDKIHK